MGRHTAPMSARTDAEFLLYHGCMTVYGVECISHHFAGRDFPCVAVRVLDKARGHWYILTYTSDTEVQAKKGGADTPTPMLELTPNVYKHILAEVLAHHEAFCHELGHPLCDPAALALIHRVLDCFQALENTVIPADASADYIQGRVDHLLVKK